MNEWILSTASALSSATYGVRFYQCLVPSVPDSELCISCCLVGNQGFNLQTIEARRFKPSWETHEDVCRPSPTCVESSGAPRVVFNLRIHLQHATAVKDQIRSYETVVSTALSSEVHCRQYALQEHHMLLEKETGRAVVDKNNLAQVSVRWRPVVIKMI
jgi:hypothetical protein